jgi:hypothetical protein
MKTFYSILYCPIRPVVDEQLSIALFIRTNERIFFRYSQDKLKVIKELIPGGAYNLLKSSLRNINDYFEEKNNQINISPLLFIPSDTERLLQLEYFNYLNKYSNNLLHFSKPTILDLEITNEVFDNLYFKFVFDADEIKGKKHLISEKVRSKINPKIKNNVNLEVELTSNQIKNLVVPTPVWFIGKNDMEVTGEVIDFTKSTHHLENDVRDYLYLLQSLKDTKTSKRYGKHFMVGNEPNKNNFTNHSIWNQVRDLSYITFITSKETDQITNYIHEHKVSPFFVPEQQ